MKFWVNLMLWSGVCEFFCVRKKNLAMVASIIPYSFVKLNQQNCPFWILRFAPVPSATKKLFLKKKFFGFSKRLFSLRVLETCSVRLLEILNSALEYRLVLVSVNIYNKFILDFSVYLKNYFNSIFNAECFIKLRP